MKSRFLCAILACIFLPQDLLAVADYPTGKLVLADYTPHHTTRPIGNGLDVWRYDGNAASSNASVKRRISNGDLIGDDGRNQIPCTVYPAVGMQSEEDEDYVEYQILQAKTARIDGFMIEWNSPGKESNRVLRTVAERLGFYVGAVWQADQTLKFKVTPTYGASPTATQWNNFLADYSVRLRQELYDQPTAPRINGRPLLLFFAWGCPAYNAQDFATLRTAWGAGSSPLLARTHLGLPDASASGNFRAGLNLVDGYYPWSTPGSAFSEPTSTDSELAPLIAANTHDFYYTGESMLAYRQRWVGYTKAFENDFPLRMGGVMGHGDNRPCGGWGSQVFYIARKDGATARAQWELYKNERNNLDAVFIATWNDWTEGTIVEPSVERGLQDVTIIEEGASGFKAVASDPTGLPLPKRLFDLRKGYAQLIRLGFPLAGCKARLNAVAEQVANRQFAAAESAIAQEEARLLSLQSQVVAQPPSVKTLVRYSADPPTTEYTATSSIPISLTLPSAMDVLMSTLRCDAELTWEWRDVDFGTYRIYTNNSGTAASDAIAEIIGSGTGQWKTAKIRVYDQNCWFTRDTNTNYGGAVLKVTGNVTFRNMVLTVTRKDLPPVIALGPVGGSVLTGGSFSLSLEAGGTGGVAYQWRKNDVNIAGATSATYTIASAQTTDGGSYSVVVSNVAGSVTSGSVSLTVDKASQSIAAFASVGSCVYGDAAFAVTAPVASSGLPVSVTVKSGPATISGGSVSLNGVGTVVLAANQSGDANYNSAAEVTTNFVVKQAVPLIISNPAASAITSGQSLSLSVLIGGSASVAGTFAFTTPSTVPSVGTTSQSVTFTPTDSTTYSSVSTSVNVTVDPAVTAPTITSQPAPLSVNAGSLASFSVTATGTTPFIYQWSKNGVSLASGTSATYTIASAQATDGGSYSVVVSNVAGSVTSGSVSLTVDKASPVIFTAPTASAITSGQALSFSVLSGGSASVAGIFAYTSPSTVPSVGTSSQSVTFTPTDVTRYNAVSTSANVTVNALVSPPAITSGTLVSGTVGAVFNYQIAATNNPTSYSVTGLLSGLTVNASTGLVSGTPTTAGQTTVTLRATNSAGTGTATLTLNITQPVVQGVPVITNVDKAGGIVGGPFTYQITATNNPSSFSATGLPAGLSVNASSGLISGTLNAAGQFPITLTATNSTGVGNANLALIVSSGAINWLDLAGTYEGLLEKSPDSQADDGAAYRGAFSLTFNRIGTVSGRVFYNEATSLGTAPNRVYVPVTRTFVGRLAASSANPLVCRKVVRLGTGTSLGRQELTLEVSFAETPPRLNLSVKDTASPSAGEDAWVSQALSCTRSLTKLPTSTSAGGGTLDYSKAVGRYTLSATDGDPSGVNNAHVLAQLLSTGKLLWTSRMKGTFGTGSTGLRVTADELNASVYEGRVSSTSTLLKSTSLLGSLNFVWDSASNSWGSNFGSETLPGKLEKQASYVSKTGGKLAFNDAQDSTGITELDFSNKDGVRWGNTTVTTVPAFLSGSTLTASPFTLNAQDPPDSDGNNASYTWNVSVTAAGRVLTTSTTDGTRRLSPRLLLTLNRQNGEFTGYYMTNISGKNVRRNIYGCGLMSQTDEALRARGWVESGVLPTLSTGGWTLQLGQ